MSDGEDSAEMAESPQETEEEKNPEIPSGSPDTPSNYKEDAKVYGIDVLVTNVVKFNVKSNDPEFARLWIQRQLAPILMRQPPGAFIKVEINRLAEGEEFAAEVYGETEYADGEYKGYKVFEHVKNEIFGSIDATE
jgi:hypothetical protein